MLRGRSSACRARPLPRWAPAMRIISRCTNPDLLAGSEATCAAEAPGGARGPRLDRRPLRSQSRTAALAASSLTASAACQKSQ